MPLLQALRDLGGSATPAEARKKIIENEHLSDEVINETRGKTQVNKFENEVAFARNYLVGAGYIDKSVRGVWTLTEAGKTVELTAEMASDIFKKGVSDAKSNKTNDSDALADNDIDTVRYWLYAPGQGADKWEECYKNGYMLLGWGEIGDLGVFSSKDEMKQQMKQEYGDSSSYKNSAHATWQFVHDIRVGDVVFVKKGNNGILGKGIVESDYEYDADRADEYSNVRKVNWTNKGNWTINHQAPQKTLTDITPYSDFVQEIKDLFEDDDIVDDEQEVTYPEYTVENFLDDVYMSEEDYSRLVGLLRNKKNIILQGAPGVGKTYAATANASQIPWQLDNDENSMLPVMQSDIMLQRDDRVLIIDAKYYEHSMQVQFNKHTLHSANLYQIFTYVKNKEYELREKDHTVSGMLLYAKTDEEIYPNNVYQMSGNQITVRTLDLNLPFTEIAEQLDTIAKLHFSL